MIARAAEWVRADQLRVDALVAALTAGIGTLLVLGAPEQFDTGWPEVAAGVGAFVLVLFRRRHTLVLLAVAMAWTAGHVAIWDRPTPTIFAALVLLATACLKLDRWQAIGLGVAAAASLYVVGLVSNDAELGDARAVIAIAWTAVAVGIADAIRSWRRYKESADAQVRSAVLAAEAEARRQVSEERLTIARELHDLLAHNLSVMNVQTGAALHVLRSDPDQAEASLSAARDAGRTVLDELRELLSVLRRDGGDAPTAALPSVDQLPALVDTMRSAGLDVSWKRRGSPRSLTPVVSLAAYRIVQEALTNAAKHGRGQAELTTEWEDAELRIRVGNEVVGVVDQETGGHGLIGMRERALVNGGRVEAGIVGDRFVVDARLPVATSREMSS